MVGAQMLVSNMTPFSVYSSSDASISAPGATTVSMRLLATLKMDASSLEIHPAWHCSRSRCSARFCCLCTTLWPRRCWRWHPMACTQVGPSTQSAPNGHVAPSTLKGSTITATSSMMTAPAGEMRSGCAPSQAKAPGPRWLRSCARTILPAAPLRRRSLSRQSSCDSTSMSVSVCCTGGGGSFCFYTTPTKGSADVSGYAAQQVEEYKIRHYKDTFDADRWILVPFVQESYGRVGKAALRFVGILASHSAPEQEGQQGGHQA